MRQNLKNELRKLYQSAPPIPKPGWAAELIAQANLKTPALSRETSVIWFIRTQLRFINRKFLVLQLLLVCLYAFFTAAVLQDTDAFFLLVPLAPIAVLLGTGELSRSFRFNMTELELPSRFSLAQILLARLVITAAADMLSLTCMLVLTAMQTYHTFGALILYGLVPSLLAASGSLFLINRCRNASAQYYVSAYCVSLSALGAVSLNTWPEWYNGAATAIWCIVLAVSAVILAAELHKMLHDCSKGLECVKLEV